MLYSDPVPGVGASEVLLADAIATEDTTKGACWLAIIIGLLMGIPTGIGVSHEPNNGNLWMAFGISLILLVGGVVSWEIADGKLTQLRARLRRITPGSPSYDETYATARERMLASM